MPEKAHATLSASGASRWMNCPGSIRMSEGIESKSSPWAVEGTAAHELAEMCLNRGTVPSLYVGQRVIDDPLGEVTEDMAAAVKVYVDFVRKVMAKADHHEIERRVTLAMWKPGIGSNMFGTADFMAYRVKTKTLLIADYKHGAGIPVDAVDNPQIMYYAAGAVQALKKWDFKETERIRMNIIQPRAPHADGPIRRFEVSMSTLRYWVNNDLMPAAERTQEPDAPLNPGSWCRFCPAAGVCPAVAANVQDKARMAFAEGRAKPKKPLEKLTPEEVGQILSAKKDVMAWLNAIEKHVYDELHAGHEIPGHKLVAARASRRWLDEETAANRLCEEFGLGDEDIFEKPKMKSPAQVEKVVGKRKEVRAVLDELWSAESTKTTVAPATDNRPEVTPSTAADAFADADADKD